MAKRGLFHDQVVQLGLGARGMLPWASWLKMVIMGKKRFVKETIFMFRNIFIRCLGNKPFLCLGKYLFVVWEKRGL